MNAALLKLWLPIKGFFVNYAMIITVVTVVGYLAAPRLYQGLDAYFSGKDDILLVRVDSVIHDYQKHNDAKLDSLIASQNVTTIVIDSLKYAKLLDDFETIQDKLVSKLPALINVQIDNRVDKIVALPVRVVDQFGQFIRYTYYIRMPGHNGAPGEWIEIDTPYKLSKDDKEEIE